jgi:flagellar basal body-associated protein FliL
MKKTGHAPGSALLHVTRVLVIIAAALILIILGGTVYAFFIRPPVSAETAGAESTGPAAAVSGSGPASDASSGGAAMFTGIGRLRIAAGNGEPATALLSITFPYPGADRAFTEELAGKVPVFRSITAAYFAALSAGELRNLDEDAAKAELLRRFNAELLLGKIEVLYFSDLMILE